MPTIATSLRERMFYRFCVVFDRIRVPEGGVDKGDRSRVRDAMRLLLASTIVQGCEVVDENLARWLKERATIQLQRTER